MTSKPASGQRVFGPDLIRATAITLVLLSHTFPGGHAFVSVRIAKYFFGYFGVEVFFVLSGYLIGGILIRELFGGRLDSVSGLFSFWKRRWFRTLPNYYLFLFIMLLLARFNEGRFPAEGKSFFWFGQALVSKDPDFFIAAWSLAIEEWFYLLFPLLLLISSRLLPNRERATLATIGIFLIVPLLLRYFLTPDTWDGGVRRVTLPRLDVIMYGVGLAFLQNRRPKIWTCLVKCWPLGVVVTAGLIGYWGIYMAYIGGNFNPDLLVYRVFFFCFTSIGLSLAFPKVVEMTKPKGWPAKVVRNMSLWSYSIYLSHTFFVELIGSVYNHAGWSVYGLNAVIISCLIWFTSLSCSAALFRFYEKPVMDLRDQPLKKILRRFQFQR